MTILSRKSKIEKETSESKYVFSEEKNKIYHYSIKTQFKGIIKTLDKISWFSLHLPWKALEKRMNRAFRERSSVMEKVTWNFKPKEKKESRKNRQEDRPGRVTQNTVPLLTHYKATLFARLAINWDLAPSEHAAERIHHWENLFNTAEAYERHKFFGETGKLEINK